MNAYPPDAIEVATFNVRAFPAMRQTRVREDLVYARNQGLDLIAWQEFWLARYRLGLHRVFKKELYGHATTFIPGTCVTWRKSKVKFESGGRFLLHESVIGVCSRRVGRYVRFIVRGTGQKITFISAHPTPSAFSDRFSGTKKAKVRAAWERGMKNLHDFIASEVRAGRTVIIGMDANAHHEHVVRALGKTIAGEPVTIRTSKATGIDHIVVVGQLSILGYWTGKESKTNSDHLPFEMAIRLPLK